MNIHIDDTNNAGETGLSNACYSGYLNIVKELIRVGADLNLPDQDGDTPLMMACREGHIDIFRELINAGADITIRNNDGDNVFIVACNSGQDEILKEILKIMKNQSNKNDKEMEKRKEEYDVLKGLSNDFSIECTI